MRQLRLAAIPIAATALMLPVQGCAAEDVAAAIGKANLYIEAAKGTERAVESWERYASWVNLKKGPTGSERYISYGMYDLHEIAGLLKEVRRVAGARPSLPKLDPIMLRYLDAYEALAPVMNRASSYYDRKGYRADNAAEGRTLHAQMVPLANAFLSQREAMLRELRPYLREVEQQELVAIEAREGRSRAWQVAHVMHAAGRVVDVFPRTRPTPMDSDTMEQRMRAVGPHSSGKDFDELIMGVQRPAPVVIDMKQLDAALKGYAEAVETFDRFAADKPEGLKDLKDLPRRLLDWLRRLRDPLARNQGREFDGGGQMMGRIVETYFSMLSASSPISGSQLRFLP